MNASRYIKIALFFIVLGGAGAGYIVLSASGISPFNTNIYDVILEDASGLSTRSKIYLAGVSVGKVQGIQLNGTEARVKLAFLKDIEIREDAIVSRKPSSLLGTAVLSLDPGSARSPVIPPGSLIKSVPPAGDLNSAMSMVGDIGSQVSIILDEFRTNQLALIAVSLEAISSIAEKIDAQSDAQLDRISRILESAALISERTERILRNSEGNITGSMADIYEASANIRAITAEIAAGRGNIGEAVYGNSLYSSILATAEKTEDAAGKLGAALENVSVLAKTTNGVVASAGEIVDKALGLGIQVDTNARFDILAQNLRAAASIRLDPRSNDRWYRIGVSSAPDGVSSRTVKETIDGSGNLTREDSTETQYSVAVDAELARKFGFITLRGGLLESTAGIGLDIQPFDWLSLSGEIFHFRAGELPNLRSSVTFYPFFNPDSDKPWNWLYIRGGVNNTLSGNRDFFIGGGLRFADREVKGLVGLVPAFN
jgi:phospholipid/cholesterol/gamma-HCH transport system substrate-binding protein